MHLYRAYRDLYYKEVDERDNPIMWLDLSSTAGTIEYKRGYPYIEWQQRVLEGDDVMVFNPQYMTLLEAQKKAIVEGSETDTDLVLRPFVNTSRYVLLSVFLFVIHIM